MIDFIKQWIKEHPARTAACAGWFQQGCGIFAAIVTIPFILNKLNPADAGLWFTFQGILAAVTLTDFGFSFVISRQVAFTLGGNESKEENDFIKTESGWEGVKTIYRGGKVLFRLITGVGVLLLIILYEGVLPFTKLAVMQNYLTAIAWYCLGLSTLILLQSKIYQAIIDGSGRMYLSKFVIGSFQIINGALVILVLLIFPNLPSISIAVLLVSILQYIVLKLITNVVSGGKLKGAHATIDKQMVSRLWKIAAPIGIVNSASYCINSIQTPLVGVILGAEKVPPYYLAQKIVQVFMMAVVQLYQPQLPIFTMDYSKGDYKTAFNRMRRTIIVVTGAMAISFIVFYLTSPFIVKIWVGEGRYVSNDILFLMTIDNIILGSAAVWGQFVLASGRNPFVVFAIINAVLNLTLATILCMKYGLIGLPLSTLICGLLTNYWFNPYHGLKLWKELRKKSE
ncbi:MAG TPA: lipopolysaccharide biosynthesis protein [Verrucomicrobiota bacterium]|nr:lipopolysaccharide biosynthesis protein [Verrucomicrobiota bacterium]